MLKLAPFLDPCKRPRKIIAGAKSVVDEQIHCSTQLCSKSRNEGTRQQGNFSQASEKISIFCQNYTNGENISPTEFLANCACIFHKHVWLICWCHSKSIDEVHIIIKLLKLHVSIKLAILSCIALISNICICLGARSFQEGDSVLPQHIHDLAA